MSSILHSVHSVKHAIEDVIDDQKTLKYRPGRAFGHTFKSGFQGNLLSVPFIAFEVGTAQRGEQVGTLVGQTTGILTYPVFAGIIAAGVAMIPGVNVAAGLIAGIVAMYPNSLLQESVTRKINWLGQTGKNIRHLETGGSYQDTDYAARARQSHMMELSSASAPMRRYLGNEARIHHR